MEANICGLYRDTSTLNDIIYYFLSLGSSYKDIAAIVTLTIKAAKHDEYLTDLPPYDRNSR
jgi:hypothetical protein